MLRGPAPTISSAMKPPCAPEHTNNRGLCGLTPTVVSTEFVLDTPSGAIFAAVTGTQPEVIRAIRCSRSRVASQSR